MKQNSFSSRARKFIQSIVRQRLFLESTDRSKNSSACFDARFIDKYLRAYPNRSDDSMAAFWMRNHDKIFNIIPGSKSESPTKRHELFYQLHEEAKRLFKNHLITPKIKYYGYTHTEA